MEQNVAENIEIRRHSLEHVMVLAMKRLFSERMHLGVGPVIDNGFYQDFDWQIAESDFEKIEAEMRQIIEEDIPFKRFEWEIPQALEYFEEQEQPYKVELLESIREKSSSRLSGEEFDGDAAALAAANHVSLYEVGEHLDLCRGPHVFSSSALKGVAFKLDRLAGAYWRGSESNPMLRRLYALAFESDEELEQYLERRAEAQRRDHRKLGPKLDLFFFDESAPGMPYWLPKGMLLRNKLLDYWRQYHSECGYEEISAPLVNKQSLWKQSGHWDYYGENMISAKVGEQEDWALKPMNCANAMIVFKRKPRSYRELPMRLSDCDLLHRAEAPGSLSGLLRARCFCQDDSHNFVADNGIRDEIEKILKIVSDFYDVFGLLGGVKLCLSLRPEKFMGDPAVWDKAERELEEVLKDSGFPFEIQPGEGAFYGPKIDIQLQDALGREWQCGTVQLDFQLPKRFDLEYVDKDGARKSPVVIHRVIYGSLERFLGILIEHFDGKMPFWIAPEQLRVIALGASEEYLERLESVLKNCSLQAPLRGNELRYRFDKRNESLSRKLRESVAEAVPYSLIVGAKEEEAGQVCLRHYSGKQRSCLLEELPKMLAEISAAELGGSES